METVERAYAKLNLSLDVIGKRPDGYHEMRMVMQSCSLCDDITLRLTDGGVTSKSNLDWLPRDGRNLANRAAGLFMERACIAQAGVSLDIFKRVPVCAGLGGGSSDAAAVLRALDRLFGTKLGAGGLERLGEELGSDVAFCVAGGTSLCTGRGEIMRELSPFPSCHIVICKPSFSISTPELFARLDAEKIRLRPDTEGLLRAISEGNLRQAAQRMYNVFEPCLEPRRRAEIDSIKGRLLDGGALGASMSGTGPSVFGIFDEEGRAAAVKDALSREYTDCFLAVPVSRIADI